MLNRHDLVEQFELVVKQEIKNHNDAVLASNILVNKLQIRLDKMEEAHAREVSKLNSEIAHLQTAVGRIDDVDREHHHHKKCLENKLDTIGLETHHSCKSLEKDLVDIIEALSLLEFDINKIDDSIKLVARTRIAKEHDLKRDVEQLQRLFYKQLEALEHKILSLPSKECKEVRALEEQVRECKLNLRFHKEEMENHKDKRFYNEKQIEYLITQFDRLKKKVSP